MTDASIAPAMAERARMTWQPISTAPRTPRAILVYVPGIKCIFAVTWGAKYNREGKTIGEGWLIFGGDWRDGLQGATHWMPFPEPPHD